MIFVAMSEQTKRCTKCGEVKPFSEFNKRGESDSLKSHCKRCVVAYRSAYARKPENRERIAANMQTRRDKGYREIERARRAEGETRAKYLARLKEYYIKNRERILDRSARRTGAPRLMYWAMTEQEKSQFRKESSRSSKRRASASLSDAYVAGLIRKHTKLSNREIPKGLIEVKRLQIQLKRELKNLCKT